MEPFTTSIPTWSGIFAEVPFDQAKYNNLEWEATCPEFYRSNVINGKRYTSMEATGYTVEYNGKSRMMTMRRPRINEVWTSEYLIWKLDLYMLILTPPEAVTLYLVDSSEILFVPLRLDPDTGRQVLGDCVSKKLRGENIFKKLIAKVDAFCAYNESNPLFLPFMLELEGHSALELFNARLRQLEKAYKDAVTNVIKAHPELEEEFRENKRLCLHL